ncbi:NAD(P)H-binding protein [Actinosynnema sp. NPDC023794]
MQITVFGATGNVGSRVVAEAVSRGHEVTAVALDASRFSEMPAEVDSRVGDASNVEDVVALSSGRDVVITATGPNPGREDELVAVAEAMLTAAADTGVRLVVVGGAGSLRVEGGGTVMEEEGYPPHLLPIAAACVDQLAACRADGSARWSYLSPARMLAPGERTGRYRVGGDELVVDADGRSQISMEDLAVALLDEAEEPKHLGARFTVAY